MSGAFRYNLLFTPVLIMVASLLAGLYGVAHNQLSYTVSPDYFRAFKFHQFAVPPALPDRFNAGLVGWMAAWWMGLVSGVPLTLLGLSSPDVRNYVLVTGRAFLIVLGTALVCGLLGLAVSFLVFPVGSDPAWVRYFLRDARIADTSAFARAGMLHDSSYAGAVLEMVMGIVFLLRRRKRLRGQDASAGTIGEGASGKS